MSEIRDGEDLWQWSWLEITLNAFRRSTMSTISQKQFIIIIIIIIIIISLKSKKNTLKNVSYFGKWNFQASSLKNFSHFRRNFQSLKIKIIFFFVFFFEIELFNYKRKRKKFFILFLIKKIKFSKLKYFLIIIIEPFFSFNNILFCTEQAFVFIFWKTFVTFTTTLSLFFIFFLEKDFNIFHKLFL